jgi:outer membrane protein TolC
MLLKRWTYFLALLSAGAASFVGGARSASAAEDDDAKPKVTIKRHRYSLEECLALTDRNHPNVWAARARLAFVHAQLDEARYAPWFNWNAGSQAGVLPQITGTNLYTNTPVSQRNVSSFGNLTPAFSIDINGTIPLYTFGKITNAQRAAEANVRVNEWDLERQRQLVRMDVRRAFFGLMLARDAKYVVDEAMRQLKKAVDGLKQRLAKDERGISETDVFRLEVYLEEVTARSGEPIRGETYALAALRFMTGVQNDFDIVDEPLKRPDRPLGPVTQYLEAARLFRPEVNMARAGVIARERMVQYNRSKYFPDIGLGLGGSYAISPSATPQTVWTSDPFNHFYYFFGVGARWSLDILPNAARVAQAESALEETRAQERLSLGSTMVEVENAHAVAVEAKVREEAWGRAEQKSKQWIATVSDQIDLGTADERAMLEPLRNWGNSRINHLYALMDLNVAMSDLARVSGWDSAAPSGK